MPVTPEQFAEQLAEVLNEDPEAVRLDTELASLEGWDSVGQLATIALIDECYDRGVNVDALRKCASVRDLIALATDG